MAPGHEVSLGSEARPAHRVEVFHLVATPAAVSLARHRVRALLTEWGVDDDVLDDVALVTSELVTNALTHSGSSRIVCRVHGGAGAVRVEVEDQDLGAGLPVPREPGPDDQGGRGLLLVGALSGDWGVSRVPGRPGRVVWAELKAHTPPTAAPTPEDPAPADPTPTERAARPGVARPIPHSAEGPFPH
ncbi:hypothetical protein WN71_018470, partial [Streptomyces mangrovisoli]